MSDNHLYAIIMAGGRGSRFWPRSRKKHSKQVLNIVGNNTMIQDTVNRMAGLVPIENIYVITNMLLRDTILRQVPQLLPDQVVAEPEPRSTAPCVGLAAQMLLARDKDAVMAVFAADHIIVNVHKFQEDVAFAAQVAAEKDVLVTFGVMPTKPETGFGYIHAGEEMVERENGPARHVNKFVEKPDYPTAEEFLEDPYYFINSGMFVWKASVIMEEFERFLPGMAVGLKQIGEHMGSPLEIKAIGEIFPKLEAISIDYGIMEKSDRVAMVPAGFGWNDIGSWSSLYDVWPKDDDGNACWGRKIAINAKNSLIYSPNKMVAAVGVENLIIVETDDALLVCHKDHAQEVSEIVNICRRDKLEEYL